MKIVVVGGGGREHAIIKKLKENKSVDTIYACPGNGGISKDAICCDIAATDIDGVVTLCKKVNADFVVVTPDDPLVLGMVDALNDAGFRTFGPNKRAAIIEGSKVYSKNLMKKYGIPTAGYEIFDDPKDALNYIEKNNTYPIVIKADGLALGKGVIIAQSYEEAKEGIHSIMEDKIFGASGNHVVIEEFLTGPEVSVLAFTDSKTIKTMVSSMDHKRVYDHDRGPNTGGMGTISPNPFYTMDIEEECTKKIFLPTIEALNKEGRPFKGCLYFGLMITPKGPYVIEYNCRFGDPETQVVLPLLETDLLTIMEAVYDETLADIDIQWKNGSCACVVMASGGYPKSYPKGLPITGLDENGQLKDVVIYHAGTKCEDHTFKTAGGRVLGVTAVGDNLQQALDKAYDAVGSIHFDGAHYRKDVGKKSFA